MHHRASLLAIVLASTVTACTLPDPEPRTNGDEPGAGAPADARPGGSTANRPAASNGGGSAIPGGSSELPGGGAGSENGSAPFDPSSGSPGHGPADVSNDATDLPSTDPPSGGPGNTPIDPSGETVDTPDEVDPPPPPPPPSTWYDLTTGRGFAAKGDVQSAFGWNDEGLTNAICSSVVGSNHDCAELFVPENLHVWFTLEAHDVYRATCEFTTGPEETVHDITIPRHMFIDSDVSSTARANGSKAITGFLLEGPSFTQLDKKIPVVGEPCVGENGNAQNGTWKTVELIESNGGLGLWVHTDLAARASDVELWKQ